MAEFAAHSIRFSYPEAWTVSEQSDGSTVAVTLQTPGTAYWSVTLLEPSVSADDAIQAAIEAYEDEYEQVDQYDRNPSALPGTARRCDLDFLALDLVTSASLWAVESDRMTILVVYQGDDRELKQLRNEFEAVTESLRWGDEEG